MVAQSRMIDGQWQPSVALIDGIGRASGALGQIERAVLCEIVLRRNRAPGGCWEQRSAARRVCCPRDQDAVVRVSA